MRTPKGPRQAAASIHFPGKKKIRVKGNTVTQTRHSRTFSGGKGVKTGRTRIHNTDGGINNTHTNYGISGKHAAMIGGAAVGGVVAQRTYRHYHPKQATHATTGGLQSRQPVKTGGRVTYNQKQKASRIATTAGGTVAGAMVGGMTGRPAFAAGGAVIGGKTAHAMAKRSYPNRGRPKGGRR